MQLPSVPHSNEALKTLATTLTQQLAERDAAIAAYTGTLAARDQELAAHKQQIAELSILNEKLKFELARYRRLRFGKHSEAIGSEQIQLWESELETDIAALHSRMQRAQEAIAPDLNSHEKAQPKRVPLPAHLARVDKRLEPESTVCTCGRLMTRIGEDVAETLQLIPATFYVERRIRGKWACRCCETLAMAPVPPAPIDKSIAGASVLAQVIVSKFQDHLPLHRQEGIYARMGVDIPRSTMAGWLGHLEVGIAPLFELLCANVVAQSGLQADETPVKVLAPGTGRTATGYLWAYRTLPSASLQAVVFDFASSRSKEHPNRMLANFVGTLQVDGYAGYNEVLARPEVIEAGCLAHARRKFVEVYEATKSPIAQEAITRIAALYELERELRDVDIEHRRRERQARAGPLLEALHEWLIATHAKAPPRSALAQAMLYALKRWPALTRYVEDGRLPPDTNAVENAIRGIAVGRGNWLFCGSEAGGRRAAMMYALIETCKLNGVQPLVYLQDVLERLPVTRRRADLEALLPWNWKPIASEVAAHAAA